MAVFGDLTHSTRREIATAVAAWLIIAALSTVLGLSLGIPFGHQELNWGFRLGLVAFAIGASAAAVALCSLPFIALSFATTLPRPLERLVCIAHRLVLVALVVFTLTSYGAYAFSGVFVNRSALLMLMHDGPQLVQHAIAFDSSRVIALTGGLFVALAAMWLVARWMTAAPERLRTVGLASLVIAAVGTVGSLISSTLAAGSQRVVLLADESRVTVTDRYASLGRTATSPFASLVSLASIERNRPLTPSAELSKRYRSMPIMSPAEYGKLGVKPQSPPNVLLILIESFRPDVLSVYGGQRTVMPAVEHLAEQAQVFANCYAHASHSNYSDVVPYSSQYPLRSWNTHYYPEKPTYPRVLMHELLQAFGYRTAIISSQDEHWGGMANFFDVGGLDYFFHSANAREKRSSEKGNMHRYREWMLQTERSGKADDRETIDALINWIGKGDGKPFAAYINLQSSHFPFWVPEGFEKPFKVQGGDGASEANKHLADYLNSLNYIDDQIARLLDHLYANKLFENTMFVVSADTSTRFMAEHRGERSGAWEIGNGGRLYEDVVRVPMIFKAPGYAAQIRRETCRHVDVLPTIVDAVGLPPHPGFQGRSMLAADFPVDSPVFLVAQTPIAQEYGVIKGNTLFIYDELAKVFRMGQVSYPGPFPVLPQDGQTQALLQEELSTWIMQQINYYENPLRQTTHYPPVRR